MAIEDVTPIDLSCDLGEAGDERQQRIEDAIWPMITSANVACGAHAGDETTMRHAVEQAKRFGVRLGAHPSYPDREHFGRLSMKIGAERLRNSIAGQIEALTKIAGPITHVKPHGALYNDAHHDRDLAKVIASAVPGGVALVASADSALRAAAADAGLPFVAEAFGDRRYRSDGSLVPRSRPDALLLDFDEAAAQALSIAQAGSVVADDGKRIRIVFKTICIHGDMEGSAGRLRRIREVLSSAGFSFAVSEGGS